MIIGKNMSKQASKKDQLSKVISFQKIRIERKPKTAKNINDSFYKIIKHKYGRKYALNLQHKKCQNGNNKLSLTANATNLSQFCRKTCNTLTRAMESRSSLEKSHIKRNTWNNDPVERQKYQKNAAELSKQDLNNMNNRHTSIKQFTLNIYNKTAKEFDISTRRTFNQTITEFHPSKFKKISCLKLQKLAAKSQQRPLVDLIRKFKFQNITKDKDLYDRKRWDTQQQFYNIHAGQQQNKRRGMKVFCENQNNSSFFYEGTGENDEIFSKRKPDKGYFSKAEQKAYLSPWVTTNDVCFNHDNIALL